MPRAAEGVAQNPKPAVLLGFHGRGSPVETRSPAYTEYNSRGDGHGHALIQILPTPLNGSF